MRISFNGTRNPFAFLFVRSRLDEYLARYVLREYARGRSLQDVLNDPYVRNRSTPEERARLLERPEVVATIGQQTVADLKLGLAGGIASRGDPTVLLRPGTAEGPNEMQVQSYVDGELRPSPGQKRALECSACRYGIACLRPPARCPMCGAEDAWVQAPWRPFAARWSRS